MTNGIRATLCTCSFLIAASAHSAETITYTYDTQGRLTNLQVSGGPANGVQRTYQYDAADNRLSFTLSGASGGGTIVISAQGSVANATTSGVSIGVKVGGSPPPTGMVTFTENGVFLGSAFISDGQASVFLEGFPTGTHTITASYSGNGTYAPSTFTFTIMVQNLGWLPAVLEILLSE